MIYKVAYKILRDEYAAEDATQLTFTRIMNNLHKIDENNGHKTRNYLVIVCSNISIDIYNRRKKELENTSELDEALYNERNTVENIVLTKESLHKLFESLRSLSPIYREILQLRYSLNYSNAEIALLLEIDEQTVRKRIERGRKKLLKLLNNEKNDGRRDDYEQ